MAVQKFKKKKKNLAFWKLKASEEGQGLEGLEPY